MNVPNMYPCCFLWGQGCLICSFTYFVAVRIESKTSYCWQILYHWATSPALWDHLKLTSDCVEFFLQPLKYHPFENVNSMFQSFKLFFTDVCGIHTVLMSTNGMTLVILVEKKSLSVQMAVDFIPPLSRLWPVNLEAVAKRSSHCEENIQWS